MREGGRLRGPLPGFDLSPGVHRYVYRFSFDGGLHWTYCDTTSSGANHGFDPALLGTFVVAAPARETIAFWNFHGQSADPTEGAGVLRRGEDQDDNIRVDGNPGWAWNIWRWNVASFDEERFAEVEVSASGFSELVFSLDLNRTASGPRFFYLSYSVDGGAFTMIDDSPDERVIETYTPFSWSLPSAADDAGTLRIRIHAFDQDAVWNGRLRLDNILVSGLAD